jgi:hypothetical protein
MHGKHKKTLTAIFADPVKSGLLAYSPARWINAPGKAEAVVEARLEGKADLNHDGHGDTAGLDAYLKQRVPELAVQLEGKPQQDPQFFKGRDAEVYTLAAFK